MTVVLSSPIVLGSFFSGFVFFLWPLSSIAHLAVAGAGYQRMAAVAAHPGRLDISARYADDTAAPSVLPVAGSSRRAPYLHEAADEAGMQLARALALRGAAREGMARVRALPAGAGANLMTASERETLVALARISPLLDEASEAVSAFERSLGEVHRLIDLSQLSVPVRLSRSGEPSLALDDEAVTAVQQHLGRLRQYSFLPLHPDGWMSSGDRATGLSLNAVRWLQGEVRLWTAYLDDARARWTAAPERVRRWARAEWLYRRSEERCRLLAGRLARLAGIGSSE